jgi:PPM family protein phosphatase
MYRGIASTASAATGAAPARQPASNSMDVEFAQLSDLGKVRQGNEDYLGHVAPETAERAQSLGWLFAIADGVGGHDLGEVASKTAIESVTEGFRSAPPAEPHPALLQRLVRKANISVVDAGRAASPGGIAMATTVVACGLRYDRVTVAHVGDSRCYLIRRNEAALLTRDHTVVNEQVRLGVLSADEARESESRHMLSRSLGAGLFVNVDISEHQVLVDDVLVLCTDGLHGSVTASEIAAVAGNATDLNKAAQRLVDIANQRDGGDNISLQLVRVRSVERVGMYRGRPYRLP